MSKYVHLMHYGYMEHPESGAVTACGKHVHSIFSFTLDPAKVTCKTCRRWLGYWDHKEDQ